MDSLHFKPYLLQKYLNVHIYDIKKNENYKDK